MRSVRSVRTFGSFGKSYGQLGQLGQLPNLPTRKSLTTSAPCGHRVVTVCTVALGRSTLAGHLDLASTDAPTAAGRCVDISHGADPQFEPHVISYQGTSSASMSINVIHVIHVIHVLPGSPSPSWGLLFNLPYDLHPIHLPGWSWMIWTRSWRPAWRVGDGKRASASCRCTMASACDVGFNRFLWYFVIFRDISWYFMICRGSSW